MPVALRIAPRLSLPFIAASCACSLACGSSHDAAPRLPLTEALLAAAREAGESDPTRDARARHALDELARQLRGWVAEHSGTNARAALVQFVFGAKRFSREVDNTSLQFVLLPSVLEQRRGSCVGLGSLALALAERLGWQVRGVMVPGHFFLRFTERGQAHNLELLRRGEEMSDAWYALRFPIPGGQAREYTRPLTEAEVRGVVEYDIGNARQRQGRLDEARRAYERARQDFPDFAEAHASAGALAQLLGALDVARGDYAAAARANPNLPGVAHNLELLESEQRAHTAP